MELSPRLKQRISRDYPEEEHGPVEEILVELMESLSEDDSERIIAAVILRARGQVDRLLLLVQTAQRDWRDALMHSGLEHSDYRARMDDEFGPDPQSSRGWRKFFS